MEQQLGAHSALAGWEVDSLHQPVVITPYLYIVKNTSCWRCLHVRPVQTAFCTICLMSGGSSTTTSRVGRVYVQTANPNGSSCGSVHQHDSRC